MVLLDAEAKRAEEAAREVSVLEQSRRDEEAARGVTVSAASAPSVPARDESESYPSSGDKSESGTKSSS